PTSRLSDEGGQATNSLPTFFHYLFVLAANRLTWVFPLHPASPIQIKNAANQASVSGKETHHFFSQND
ncbi:MAG: hypothetical protein ACLUKQ_12030, partial [Peptococcaceae bacterium]